jgi:hypothetical protein
MNAAYSEKSAIFDIFWTIRLNKVNLGHGKAR